VYHRRSGGQSQFSALLELEPKSDRIQNALAYAKRKPGKELTVDELADAAHLSRRQFSRSFRIETGQSPAKAIETLRVEAARLNAGEFQPLDRRGGQGSRFADPERMRRAFHPRLSAIRRKPSSARRKQRWPPDSELQLPGGLHAREPGLRLQVWLRRSRPGSESPRLSSPARC